MKAQQALGEGTEFDTELQGPSSSHPYWPKLRTGLGVTRRGVSDVRNVEAGAGDVTGCSLFCDCLYRGQRKWYL